MTTYELPPEPPVGSKVHPSWRPDVVWYRSGHDGGWSTPGRPWYSWAQLLGKYEGQGLTLIEPDPWPTAPLIVADWTSRGTLAGRGMLYREPDSTTYWTVRESNSVYSECDGDALTNVVPVRVVPAEHVDYLSAAHASWVAGAIDDRTMIGYAIGLLESLDALGVSND